MKIYNQEKTQELTNVDLTKGYLISDVIQVEIPGQAGTMEKGHWHTIKEYENGGKDVEWVVDVPGIEPVEPKIVEEQIYVFIPYSNEELLQKAKEERISVIKIRLNQLSEDFVQYELGAIFTDFQDRKNEFIALHNELRRLLGKEPRQYI